MRAFDQSRYVCNHERAKVSEIYDAEVRLERGERIIRDLRTRCRHGRDKRRLPCVGEAHQTDVCEQLEFELQLDLFSLASALMVARRAIGGSREVRISKPAAAAARRQPAIAVVTEIVQQVAGCCVKDLCPDWNSNYQIVAIMSGTIRSLTVRTTLGSVLRVVTQMQERVERTVCNEDHIAAAATVTTGWTTARDKFLAPESRYTVTSVTPLHVNLGAINKHLN